MNHNPRFILIESRPDVPQLTKAHSSGASLMSGFPASVYRDPEESAEKPGCMELMDIAENLVDVESIDIARECDCAGCTD